MYNNINRNIIKKNYVSIIGTSFKNSELEVIKSLQSCLTQKYKFFEIIVVLPPYYNNLQVFKRHAYKNLKILITPKKENLAKSLNVALRHTTGEFIARVDFDDVHCASKLLHQIKVFKKNKSIDVCGTNAFIKFKNEVFIKRLILPELHLDIKKLFFFFNAIAHPTVMFRKKEILKIKAYNNQFNYSEDLDLWLRSLKARFIFYNLQMELTLINQKNSKIRVAKNFLYNYKTRFNSSKKVFGIFFGTINILFFYLFYRLSNNFKEKVKFFFYKKLI